MSTRAYLFYWRFTVSDRFKKSCDLFCLGLNAGRRKVKKRPEKKNNNNKCEKKSEAMSCKVKERRREAMVKWI